MMHVVAVQPRTSYTLWLRYADGVEGIVDLTSLAGRGVFSAWREPGRFASVRIDEFGALSWGDGLELDPDALYLQITGKSLAEIFPALQAEPASTAKK
jgi:hypothetical protein